MSTAVAIY